MQVRLCKIANRAASCEKYNMKSKEIKFGKIAVVIFLTILIWVWADLALDETLPEKSAVVVVDESVDPKLWISFDKSSSANIKIILSGPHTAVTTLDRELRKGRKQLEFVFNAVQEKMDKPGDYSLNLLPFLRKDRELSKLGLKIQTCDPNEISVNVVQLVKKSLTVECFDTSGNPLKPQSIEPPTIDAFVPEDSRLTARVILSRSEIDRAKLSPYKKSPSITLAQDHVRLADTKVKIKLLPLEDALREHMVIATLDIAMSPNLQGKYKVELTNLDEVMQHIAIRATTEAKQAYEAQPYPPMTLHIFDDDAKKPEEKKTREVVYNFPSEFVRKGQIELKNPQQPAKAEFILIPQPSTEPPPGP